MWQQAVRAGGAGSLGAAAPPLPRLWAAADRTFAHCLPRAALLRRGDPAARAVVSLVSALLCRGGGVAGRARSARPSEHDLGVGPGVRPETQRVGSSSLLAGRDPLAG